MTPNGQARDFDSRIEGSIPSIPSTIDSSNKIDYNYSMQYKFKISPLTETIKGGNPSLFKLFKAQGYCCFYCGSQDFDDLTRDHLLPKMGKHTQTGNVVAACDKCNAHKGHTPPTLEQVYRAYQLYKKLGCKFITVVKGGKFIKGGKKPLIQLLHSDKSVVIIDT